MLIRFYAGSYYRKVSQASGRFELASTITLVLQANGLASELITPFTIFKWEIVVST